MGVRGLQTYLKQIGASRQIHVASEIRASGQKQPLIVIDLLTLIHALSGPPEEEIFGHRNQNAWQNASHFCDTMIAAGARLVFFIDGKLQESKYTVWIQNQEEYLKKCLTTLDNLTCQNMQGGSNRFRSHGNVTKHAFTSALIAAARSKGVLVASYDEECDCAVATYAKKHNALAIFTGDTDYLIFEGSFRIWSSSDLKLGSMETCEWDRELLLRSLKLEWDQMPYFAAIAGNDLFHKRPKHLQTMNAIAQEVKRLRLGLKSTIITSELCKRIFNTQESIESDFKNAVMFYNLNCTNDVSIIPPNMTHYPNCALHILLNIPSSIRLPFLNLLKAEYSKIALKFYSRQVGILFQPSLSPKVIIKLDHYSRYAIVSVKPILPPESLHVPVPNDLYSLDDSVYAKLSETKHIILCWLISGSLDAQQLIGIDAKYLLDVLTLFFLVENNLITEETADIILIAVHHAITHQINQTRTRHLPSRANAETCFLYLNFYTQVYFCAEMVGLRKELDGVFLCKFDGVYFDTIADNMRRSQRTRQHALGQVHRYRLYHKCGSRLTQ